MVATSNNTNIAHSLETVPGTINANPVFQIIPTTGGSPVSNVTTAKSETIRADRQTTDLIRVDSDVSGDISYELDFNNYTPLMKSLLRQDTVNGPVSETGLTLTVATSKLAGTGLDAAVEVGDVFWMASATNPDNDMFRVVIDTSTTDEITFAPAVPVGTTDASSDVTLDITETIINGHTNTPDTYTIRKKVVAPGSGTYSYYYKGCEINTMNWSLSTGSILSGSLGIVGLSEEVSSTIPGQTGETELASEASPIMNSTSSVGSIYVDGVNLGTCKFSSLDLTYDNQINLAKSVGTQGACATAAFSIMVSGSVEVYFNDLSAYNAFLDSTGFSVTVMLKDSDGNGIGMSMQNCKFENLDSPISGLDSFLMQSGSFAALMDSTLGHTFKLSLYDVTP